MFRSSSYRCVKCVRIRDFSGPFFSRSQTEFGVMLRISPYSVRMRENTDQVNSKYGQFHAVYIVYDKASILIFI